MATRPSVIGDNLRHALRRANWAWLGTLVRQLELGFDVVDQKGGLCSLVGATSSAGWPQRRLNAVAHDAALQAAVRTTINTDRLVRLALEGLDLAVVPVHIADQKAVC